MSTTAYASLSSVVFLVGLTNGMAPFLVRLIFGDDRLLLIALPLLLPSPWWWVVSLVVLATAAVLLELLDRAGRRAGRGRDLEEADPRGD